MIDTNGIEILIDGRKRTYVDVKIVRRSIAMMLKQMDVPSHLVGQVLGVSRQTVHSMTSGAASKVPPEFMAMLRESGVVARDPSDSSYERPLTVNPDRVGINLDILPPGYAPD